MFHVIRKFLWNPTDEDQVRVIGSILVGLHMKKRNRVQHSISD